MVKIKTPYRWVLVSWLFRERAPRAPHFFQNWLAVGSFSFLRNYNHQFLQYRNWGSILQNVHWRHQMQSKFKVIQFGAMLCNISKFVGHNINNIRKKLLSGLFPTKKNTVCRDIVFFSSLFFCGGLSSLPRPVGDRIRYFEVDYG